MSTSIDDLLKGGGNTGASMNDVDAILEELNNSSKNQQPPPSPPQIAPPQQQQQQQPDPMMMMQLQQQQQQLQQLSQMNREKDLLLSNMSKESKNMTKNSNENINVDLLTEFKPTLIIFVILIVLNLPILNNFVSKTIGIENDNTIFAILKTFVMCIIFFLINKFL